MTTFIPNKVLTMNDSGLTNVAISARNIRRQYGTLSVLKGVDLEIINGSMVSIVGKSGSGKSTLLHILGTLDSPDSGELTVLGKNVKGLKGKALASWRNQKLGFIFQFHHLLPEFSAVENVALPSMIAGASRKDAISKAGEFLDYLQLGDRLEHKPGELSGGEQQRVAIGRALINQPDILLADEPTGNLDTDTSAQVHQLLRSISNDLGKTMIIVTHNQELAKISDVVYEMRDGLLFPETSLSKNPSV